MKKIFILSICIFLSSCVANKKTFWCGDHPCINKKEKQAYFKKTMIVEIKELSKKKLKEYTEIEEITKNAKKSEAENVFDEYHLAKQKKINDKARKKAEKDLIKQRKADEKKQREIEGELAKQIEIEEKKLLKEKKDLSKTESVVKKKNLKTIISVDDDIERTDYFYKIVENVKKKNALKSYPNINDIPN